MGEIPPEPLPPTVTFAITPLASDDDDREELTCIWCNQRGCDGTIKLLGGGRTIISGLHSRCIAMHQAVQANLSRIG